MRKLLTLLAAGGLTLIGLSGTATATATTPQQTGPEVVINEVGIGLERGLITGINYVELHNLNETTAADLDGWSITSCTADGIATTTSFVSGPTIPAGGFLIMGNSNYASSGFPPLDVAMSGALDPDGGLMLTDDTGTAVHSVIFTASPSGDLETCLQAGDFTPEVSPSPTTSEVAERCFDASDNPFWQLTDQPTPRNTNDCSSS